MNTTDTVDRTGLIVIVGVFVALLVDGMDLQMLALALPNISKDLQLSPVRAGALSTYTLLGMGIGGVLAGWLADRIGRVRVVWWAVLIFSAFTGVIALCQSYWQVAVMRFLSGFGIGSLYSIGTLLAAEYVPTRVRTTVLGTLQAAVGDLNNVKRIVKVMSLVNSTPDFTEQHLVTNGASELFGEVFGEKGAHARSAFGVAQIPMGACVEIELIAEV